VIFFFCLVREVVFLLTHWYEVLYTIFSQNLTNPPGMAKQFLDGSDVVMGFEKMGEGMTKRMAADPLVYACLRWLPSLRPGTTFMPLI
jgi:hypothetical protein